MDVALSAHTLMALVALQVGIQPQVTKACVAPTVSGESLVFAEMFVSILFAITIVPKDAFSSWSPWESGRVVFPPATAYALRSLVKQAAYRRCDGVTFNVMNQTKVAFCAFASWFLLDEAQTFEQCIALGFAIAAGVALTAPASAAVALAAANSPTAKLSPRTAGLAGGLAVTAKDAAKIDGAFREHSAGQFRGGVNGAQHDAGPAATARSSGAWLALATAGFSGVAAALSQAAMRASARPSALFNLELGIWGLPWIFFSSGGLKRILCLSGGGAFTFHGALRGWQCRTLAPVALQAVGGLMVSAVVKQQGGVAMGLCTVAGIAVSALVDAARTGRPPNFRQVVATAFCGLSVVVHQLGSAWAGVARTTRPEVH